ncbi:MAG: HD domain-containing protein [Muribaculaceae bacterium]|nr:HD domain-containing protein [Muribaculaceae bacterium]
MRVFDEIREFVEREIIPCYDHFDAGHGRDHVQTVISQALSLAQYYPDADQNILLVAAAYHDLGLAYGREEHHIHSARIVREDERLRQWFNDDEINTIADAAEDHRASSTHEPRSIYGRIVAEADRVIDSEAIVRRALQYGMRHEPGLDREGQYLRLMEHMQEKYAEGGYLKLWVPYGDNAKRLAEFRSILTDESAFRGLFDTIYDTLTNETDKR